MKFKNIIILLFIINFIIIFIISAYFIIESFLEYRENEQLSEELVENVMEINPETKESYINWKKLISINKDIIGWIKIEDTKINYPILKDTSNLYYLKHTYNKQYSSSGSIFTTNENPFEDEETIIYGHNMKNGSMFSSLGKYLDKDFFNSHQSFNIYTPTGNYNATIFSAYSIGIETESNNIRKLGFIQRIEYYKKISKHFIGNVDTPTKIIKLSTCSYLNNKTTPTDQRYYIIASIIPIK